MGEFDLQKADIITVEKQAGEKKHESLQQKLQTNRDLFTSHTDKVENALADALKSLTSQEAKDALKADQTKIRDFLKSVADKGRSILSGKEGAESVDQMIEGLRSAIKDAKNNIDFYTILDKSRELAKASIPGIKLVYDLQAKGGSDIDKKMDKATDQALGDLQVARNMFDAYKDKALPQTLKTIYDAELKKIDDQIAKILQIREAYTDIAGKEKKLAEIEQYFNNDNLTKNSNLARGQFDDIVKSKNLAPERLTVKLKSMGEQADKALTDLCKIKKEAVGVSRDALLPDQQKKYDEIVKKLGEQLQEMTGLKVYAKNQELIDRVNKTEGGKYLQMESKVINGQFVTAVTFTEEFQKLPELKQQEIKMALQGVSFEVALDVAKKTGLPEDKSWLEGQQKLDKGDRAGAKALFLDYVAKFKNNPEKRLQVENAKGMLRAILREDLNQVKEHFSLIKQTIEGRGGGVTGKFDELRSVHDKHGRLDAVNGFIKQAEGLIASGEALTIDEIYKKLPKLKDSIDLKSDGISMLDPFEQQQLLNEADPAKRRQNILKLARAAKAVELTALSAKYYEMYFADRIDGAKKSISREKIKADIDQEELTSSEFRAEIKAQIKSFHDSARQKFMDEYYKEHPGAKNPALSKDDPEVKAMKAAEEAWDKSYDAQKGNVYQQAKDVLIDIRYDKAAKIAIHKGVEAITRSGSGMTATEDEKIWKEAYGNIKGNVENITGEHLVFTQDDFYELQSKMAGSILTMEIATLAAMTVATGASAAIAGGALTSAGGGTAGFLIEGLVMHSTTAYLNEGKIDLSSPEFLRGLASTYATLGIMKATGLGGNVKLGGKAPSAVAEKTASSAIATVAKGGAEFLGKVTLDSTLMTGLSTLERGIVDKKWASFDEMAGEFGNNAITFLVIGGLHKVAEERAPTKKGIADTKAPTEHASRAYREGTVVAELSMADRKNIDHNPKNQPHDTELEAIIKDKNEVESDYNNMKKRLRSLRDQANLDLMTKKDNHELTQQIDALIGKIQKYSDSLRLERAIEREAREDFAQKHIDAAANLHPDIFRPILFELMMKNPVDYERVIYLSKQSVKLEASGLHQAARDLKNLTGDFATVDGSPLKTAEQRAAFLEKMLTLSPLEHEWYTTRPETTIDTSYSRYEENFNTLKEFSAKFLSEKVLPGLIAKNLPISELILEIHRWQTRGSQAQLEILGSPAEGYDISGKVRDVQVSVGNYIAPIPGKVPALLGKMSTSMQNLEVQLTSLKKTNPAAYEKAVVKTALYALQTFVDIHPMRDGNGRTSRTLYEYYIVKFLGPTSKYRRLPMTQRDNGEPTLHDELHQMNGKLQKTLYENKPYGRLEGLYGDQLSKKIDAISLAELNADPLYKEFFAKYNTLMASSP